MESCRLHLNRRQEIDQAQRLLGRDIELAMKAQAGLFPRRLPLLETLSYAGVCMQAQEVGGDYYDFFSTAHRRMGFAVADVTGKGLGAALLMANLQGILRSQLRLGGMDIAHLPALANQLCLESWPEATYATLFLAEYDDEASRLRYVNCGHPPPLLVHAEGSLDQLESTAGVLGLFEEWECATVEMQLSPGDTLLAFSDGLMETLDAGGTEFGRARVADLLRAGGRLPVSLLLESIVDEVKSFSQEQGDDMTMVAIRCGKWQ